MLMHEAVEHIEQRIISQLQAQPYVYSFASNDPSAEHRYDNHFV